MYTGKCLSPECSGIIGKSRDYNDYCCLWCKSAFKKAEINHIDNTIQKGLDEQSTKPFLALRQVKMSRFYWCDPSQEGGIIDQPPQGASTYSGWAIQVYLHHWWWWNIPPRYKKESKEAHPTTQITTDKGISLGLIILPNSLSRRAYAERPSDVYIQIQMASCKKLTWLDLTWPLDLTFLHNTDLNVMIRVGHDLMLQTIDSLRVCFDTHYVMRPGVNMLGTSCIMHLPNEYRIYSHKCTLSNKYHPYTCT